MSELGRQPNGDDPNGDRPDGKDHERPSPETPSSGDRARDRHERHESPWDEALTEAELLKGEAKDRELRRIALRAVAENKEASFQAADRITDERLQRTTYGDMAILAAPTDPDAALEAAEASSEDHTYAVIADLMAHDYPSKAFEAVNRIQEDELWRDRLTAFAEMATPEQAAIFVPKIQDPERQEWARETIARMMKPTD